MKLKEKQKKHCQKKRLTFSHLDPDPSLLYLPITLVDNEPYSEKLLDSRIRGKHPYVLTFETFQKRDSLQNSDPLKLAKNFSVPLPVRHSNGLSLRPSDFTPRAKTPKGKRSKNNPFPVTKFGVN